MLRVEAYSQDYSTDQVIAAGIEECYSSPIIEGPLAKPYRALLATPLEEAIKVQYETNLSREGVITDHQPNLTQKELTEIIGNYHIVIIRSNLKIQNPTLQYPGVLRIIGRAGVGVDNIDQQAADERGIYVFNTPEASTPSVAELAMGLLLDTARKIHQLNGELVEGRAIKLNEGLELYNKTLGIIGFGRIGRAVAKRAKGFEMKNILAYDPFPSTQAAKELGVDLLPLEEVLKESDFITLHAPSASEPLITEAAIALMKPTALLINAARGDLIDEEALIRALEDRRIAGAGLDVYKNEKSIDSRLRAMADSLQFRVVLTPHVGAATEAAQLRIADELCGTIVSGLRGEPVKAVNNRVFRLAA